MTDVSCDSALTCPIEALHVHGAVELAPGLRGVVPHRLPAPARRQIHDPGTAAVAAAPAGVRLRLRTAARRLMVTVLPTDMGARDDPTRPAPLHDVLVDGSLLSCPVAQPLEQRGSEPVRTAEDPGLWQVDVSGSAPDGLLPAGDKLVEIWLPYEEPAELVDIHADAPVAPAPSDGPRWVHHGSSISHGSDAEGPSRAWPAVAAQAAGLDLVNLGLAGNAMLDQFTARTIRDLPADVITLKLGINVVNGDVFRLRSFSPAVHGFLDTIRDGHPTTPLHVVTPLWCGIQEHTPGPVVATDHAGHDGVVRRVFHAAGDPAEVEQGRLTLTVVRAELARIVGERAQDDPHLHLVDGLSLYGPRDAERLPLPDALHPDTATHALIGERFARILRSSWPACRR
ncbi:MULTISPECIES: GDSL-type esterase/lipase family protein [unclassified Nesterenkonia]|uniref:GDSL-type esterase/lipase family protein n=1 Tax=unclassified Nesterenkonia TaxID=2629769 RepID=UPI000A19F47B|nr:MULTISPECIES: GDSL-type esterase/lipase family protein [unclassified Nesterenkonia]MDS2171783.1 SGNH/GDSL hydrolase family protein [Nesterenkonia sp. CL21]OSM43937.1 hypothetical protein BCY76_005160 [Nesterenkonia sp. PF2B19]